MNKALIVIDMQNDFCHQNGVLTTPEAQAIIPKVAALVDLYHENGDTIYYTRDSHDENYLHTQEGQKLPIEHCKYGSWGWRVVNEVDLQEVGNSKVYHLDKETFAYNAWEDEHLDQYDEVVICGVVSSICVIANAIMIKALYPELPIKFIAYASAGLNSEDHKAAIQVMRSSQIEVIE